MIQICDLQGANSSACVVNSSDCIEKPIFSFKIMNTSSRETGAVKFLTKGDNNSVDDRGLYAPGQLWLTKKDVVGRARGFLPYVGMVTIYMNEYPKFKVSRKPHDNVQCATVGLMYLFFYKRN